jgi:transcriptional antiterminator RfaH
VSQREAADTCRWYVIRTKQKQETRAESNLLAWGIETFAPRARELRRRHATSGSAFCIAALFPGYLFARFDATNSYAKVRLTRRIHSVVGFGESATPVDDAIISAIRGRIQEDGFVHFDDAHAGDPVEVVDGPLRSLVGIFDGVMSGGDRVRILLNAIAYPARVSVREGVHPQDRARSRGVIPAHRFLWRAPMQAITYAA